MYEGLYEQVVTRAVEDAIGRLSGLEARTAPLDDGDGPTYLARLVAAEVFRVLASVRKIDEQARIANILLRGLREAAGLPADESLEVASPEKLLFAVHRDGTPERRPETPLSISSLLASPGKPHLGLELIREIETADRVDALVGFIRWTGLRQLLPAIRSRASQRRPFRLIATTYTGATEAAAVKELASIPGVEVKVSYDGRRTRLHAKAWLFHRETGFSTAYIGSANLSGSGLGMGLEWVLKVTEQDLKHVVDAFRGAFDSLWEDPEFERFDPGADLERLEKALTVARGGPAACLPSRTPFFFDLRPYPFQEEILDALVERRAALQETRSLIVAATGSGKTMIAAFDYARQQGRPRLLFVAHRKEILEQAISAFRHVLRDGSFGELLAGDSTPERGEHLFATVQSLSRGSWLESRGGDYWP